ncbi:MAG: hypothetical protein V4568_14730 [Pseudomonadota bacterium]
MGWLASLIAMVAEKLLEVLGKDIVNYINREKAIKAAQDAAVAAALASVQPLKYAKDGKEVSDATRSALDGT